MRQLDLIDQAERRDSIFRDFLEEGDGSKIRAYASKNLKNSEALFVDKPSSRGILDWIIRFQPATLEDIKLDKPLKIVLPSFIPCVDLSDKKILHGYNREFLAVSGSSILHNLLRIQRKGLHNVLGLEKSIKLIARLFAKDEILETFSKEHSRYLEILTNLDIDIFISANFSIVRSNPISDQVINSKRGLWEAVELSKLGAKVIPHIFWANIPHMQKIAKRLMLKETNINLAAVDLGEMGRELFGDTVEELKSFKRIVGDGVKIVISGPSTINRIEKLKIALGNITLINSQAARLAKCGEQLKNVNGELIPIPHRTKGSERDIFFNNIDVFNSLVQEQNKLEPFSTPYFTPSDKIFPKLHTLNSKQNKNFTKMLFPSWIKNNSINKERR